MSTALLCAILALGQAEQGQFTLRAQTENPASYVYLPVTIHVALRNNGPSLTVPIGLERVNVYTFVTIWHEDKPKVRMLWKDTSVPEINPVPSRPELFSQGEERNATLTVGWQPELPVLHEVGLWHVEVTWNSPEGSVRAEPIEIHVAEPSGANGEVLSIIREANALAALSRGFWESNEAARKGWMQLTNRILNQYPSTTYTYWLSKAAKGFNNSSLEEN